MRALLVRRRVGVGRRAVDHHDSVASAAVRQRSQQRLALLLADSERVDRDVGVDVGAVDQARVGDDRHALRSGVVGDRGGGSHVDRVDHEHLRAVGDRLLGLLLLLGGVLLGVGVDHLAVGTELSDLVDEARPILVLVARGLRLRQQQCDLRRVAAATTARAGAGAATTVVVAAAAGGGAERERAGQHHGGPCANERHTWLLPVWMDRHSIALLRAIRGRTVALWSIPVKRQWSCWSAGRPETLVIWHIDWYTPRSWKEAAAVPTQAPSSRSAAHGRRASSCAGRWSS